ncbi:hypothetical protein FKZ61_018090 [Litorilinea aerophila]|uniref:Uncharacterized protein n=1 Tax=Litorilinea aerophila TaxID=1204385 RepID=A0A540VBM5_9CHLR|nr:hypothetical protein [Litorilinea aerophila]MCC9078011.1 hypothetical protein [Litorilinea aerophila]
MNATEPLPPVTLITDSPPGPPVRHGLEALQQALLRQGYGWQEESQLRQEDETPFLAAGLTTSPTVARLLEASGATVPEVPEALCIRHIRWRHRPGVLVAGSDERGLMYGLLDVADRIGWVTPGEDPFRAVRDLQEQPAVSERAISKYTMHHAYFDGLFHDEAYWRRYLDLLAQNRFNSFVLIFGYECSGYFAPPYPYFFNLDEFPEVHVVGLTAEHQQRNLEALRRLVQMCHERGLNVTLGIWDHIYRGGVQVGLETEADGPLRWRVSGVTSDNLMAYNQAGLARLLQLVPDLDAIQFRMHWESGLQDEEARDFWAGIYEIMARHGHGIRFDARIKGVPDAIIEMGLDKGLPIRVCTKYWMEQMGLPFHPTHIHPQNQMDRRHSYADLLRYPQRYKVHWRLWNGGTNRILLWGDPDYVRRFAASTHLYDGDGFEVNEPLATKMLGQDHDAAPFELLTPRYRHYTWEFERYWHFFQTFGRLGYNPDTPAEVWEHEFERRFGPEAAPYVMRGLHLASRILPRIVAYNYPYRLFPTTRGWVEKQRMGDLPEYAAALPSDTQQFLSMDEAARLLVEGGESAKIHPIASSLWFEQTAAAVLAAVDQACRWAADPQAPEFVATITDLKILAQLARYHASRARAGYSYAIFQHTQDVHALDDAIRHEALAVTEWRKLVEAAGDVYHHDLMMGRRSAGLSGHWRDELEALEAGLQALQAERETFQPPSLEQELHIAHAPRRKHPPDTNLVVRATIAGPVPLVQVHLGYGPDPQAYHYLPMEQTGPFTYQAVIPAQAVRPGLSYTITAQDESGRSAIYPTNGPGFLPVMVTEDTAPPTVDHLPITAAPAHRPLRITAEVDDPSGVKWVHLRYRSVNQYQDFQTLPMQPIEKTNWYLATVPAAHLDPRWDFMYFIEVMDNHGNGKIYPDLEQETPYIVVKLIRE